MAKTLFSPYQTNLAQVAASVAVGRSSLSTLGHTSAYSASHFLHYDRAKVAAAVRPDGMGLEQPEHTKNKVKKAAESKQLLPLLDRLVAAPPATGLRQAHQQLLTREERRQWEQGLASARVALSNGGLPHYLLGELDHSESLAAAHVARKCGASLVMIDTHVELPMRPPQQQQQQQQQQQPASQPQPAALSTPPSTSGPKVSGEEPTAAAEAGPAPSSSLQALLAEQPDDVASSFQAWWPEVLRNGDDMTNRLAERFCTAALLAALPPDAAAAFYERRRRAAPETVQAAAGRREAAMCARVLELCCGTLTGKPRARVLLVVGRPHAAPLAALLRSATLQWL